MLLHVTTCYYMLLHVSTCYCDISSLEMIRLHALPSLTKKLKEVSAKRMI